MTHHPKNKNCHCKECKHQKKVFENYCLKPNIEPIEITQQELEQLNYEEMIFLMEARIAEAIERGTP